MFPINRLRQFCGLACGGTNIRSETGPAGKSVSASRRRMLVQELETRRVLTATINVTVDAPAEIDERPLSEVVFTLTRDESDEYLAVEFELSGDAIYDTDYRIIDSAGSTIWLPADPVAGQPVLGTVTFEPGEASVEVSARPLNDTLTEIDEDIILSIQSTTEFSGINGAASLVVRNQETVYYVVDSDSRIGTVDVETGRIDVLGTVNSRQRINDIAITEDGRFFAISADDLYQLDLENIEAGVIATTFVGFHNILNANALVDARDEDFGSEEGDLFAVGQNGLAIQRIDLEIVDDDVVFQNTTTVFNIAAELQSQAFHSDYVSSGDLDYFQDGDLVLSARRPSEDFDSLIEIQTPSNVGTIDNVPAPAQDPAEDFVELYGLAFDGNDSYAFSGHTLLSVGQFNRDVSRVLEMTGRPYLIGAEASATATILGDPVAAPVVSLNQSSTDPADLSKGTAPTDWATQQSSIREIHVQLGWPITSVPDGSIVLTNLGMNIGDPSQEISLRPEQIVLDSSGESLRLLLDPLQMTDGRYQLELSAAVTTGEAFSFAGDAANGFYVLSGDFDGNGGVDIRDFQTIAYWYGVSTPSAPDYVDVNVSGRVDTADMDAFSDRFGLSVQLPGAPPFDDSLAVPSELATARATVLNRLDVNGLNGVTPLDALNVINRIARGIPTITDWRFDVGQDGSITPRDALIIINSLAVGASGEGESVEPTGVSDFFSIPPLDHNRDELEVLQAGIEEAVLLNS